MLDSRPTRPRRPVSVRGLCPRRGSGNMVRYLAALLVRNFNGRATDRLDHSHHHRWNRRLARRAVHESQMGLVMNIVLGIIGAAVASWIFGLLLYMYARACVTPGGGVLEPLNIAATPSVSLRLDDPRPAPVRLPTSRHR